MNDFSCVLKLSDFLFNCFVVKAGQTHNIKSFNWLLQRLDIHQVVNWRKSFTAFFYFVNQNQHDIFNSVQHRNSFIFDNLCKFRVGSKSLLICESFESFYVISIFLGVLKWEFMLSILDFDWNKSNLYMLSRGKRELRWQKGRVCSLLCLIWI